MTKGSFNRKINLIQFQFHGLILLPVVNYDSGYDGNELYSMLRIEECMV